MTGLLRVDSGFACFGLVFTRGVCTRAAPIAGWCVGKGWREVASYWRRRGAGTLFYDDDLGRW